MGRAQAAATLGCAPLLSLWLGCLSLQRAEHPILLIPLSLPSPLPSPSEPPGPSVWLLLGGGGRVEREALFGMVVQGFR